MNLKECSMTGKRIYQTEEIAMKTAVKMGTRRRGYSMKHYACRHCNLFHLTRIQKPVTHWK